MTVAVNFFITHDSEKNSYKEFLFKLEKIISPKGAEVIASKCISTKQNKGLALRNYFILIDFINEESFQEFIIDAEKYNLNFLRDLPNTHYIWTLLKDWDIRVSTHIGNFDYSIDILLALFSAQKLFESKLLSEKIIKVNANNLLAWKILGAVNSLIGNLDGEIKAFKQCSQLAPEDPKILNNLANSYKKAGNYNDAINTYERALQIQPNFYEAHCNLALLQTEIGDFNLARRNLYKCLEINPCFGKAHRFLSRIKEYSANDKHFLKMLSIMSNISLNDADKCELSFALAKACEDLGYYEKAIKYLHTGNKLRKNFLNYDHDEDINFFKCLKRDFLKLSKISYEFEKQSKLIPIFIVGMPRSGTSLVEQIISQHSLVSAGGELAYASKFVEMNPITTIKSNQINSYVKNFRESYLKQLRLISEKGLLTDKFPQNFCFLGLISLALPEAKIIHIKRDKNATCLSNYRSYFSSKAFGYSYDIKDAYSYYYLYEDIMSFWKKNARLKIYDVSYEKLIENPKDEIKKIIEFLNLGWEIACLYPEKNKRPVTTLSNYQVRKKIYNNRSMILKNYEPFISEYLND